MGNPMTGWRVYRTNRRGTWTKIDTVYFQSDMSSDDVKSSLIDHDGFAEDIIVLREQGKQ